MESLGSVDQYSPQIDRQAVGAIVIRSGGGVSVPAAGAGDRAGLGCSPRMPTHAPAVAGRSVSRRRPGRRGGGRSDRRGRRWDRPQRWPRRPGWAPPAGSQLKVEQAERGPGGGVADPQLRRGRCCGWRPPNSAKVRGWAARSRMARMRKRRTGPNSAARPARIRRIDPRSGRPRSAGDGWGWLFGPGAGGCGHGGDPWRSGWGDPIIPFSGAGFPNESAGSAVPWVLGAEVENLPQREIGESAARPCRGAGWWK